MSSMADNVQQQAQAAASNVPQSTKAPDGRELTEEEKKKQTWSQYGKEVYNEQYERWMPWIEDFYLRWFTRDNKASYATKGISSLYFPFHSHIHPHAQFLTRDLFCRHSRQVQSNRR